MTIFPVQHSCAFQTSNVYRKWHNLEESVIEDVVVTKVILEKSAPVILGLFTNSSRLRDLLVPSCVDQGNTLFSLSFIKGRFSNFDVLRVHACIRVCSCVLVSE